MRKLMESNRLLLLVYGCLLLGLASFFVIRESHLLGHMHNQLPFLFMIRLGLFWFVSLMIAVVIYLVHLSYHHFFLKRPDKVLARWAGYFIFWLGVAGSLVVSLLLYLFRKYPTYFYL